MQLYVHPRLREGIGREVANRDVGENLFQHAVGIPAHTQYRMDDLADRRIESAQQCGDGLDEQRHVVGDDLQCGPDAGAVGRTVDAGDRFTRQAPRREQHVLRTIASACRSRTLSGSPADV